MTTAAVRVIAVAFAIVEQTYALVRDEDGQAGRLDDLRPVDEEPLDRVAEPALGAIRLDRS
jgi:hypothetical protein